MKGHTCTDLHDGIHKRQKKNKLGQIFWNGGQHDSFSAHTDRNDCDRLERHENLMKKNNVCGDLYS
nr:unnamed protein product [Callosobruchus chinensis]